jgi:hypothetical protein
MLIYAADEGVHAAEHVVVRSGKRLSVVALDLTAPPKSILRQIGTIAHRIGLTAAQPALVSTSS